MTLSLSKGQNLSLSKNNPGVEKFTVGLGWDARTTTGDDFDLDAFALLLGADGKVRSNDDFVFFNQKQDAAGSVVHGGDNLTGAGDGDDEQIEVDLSKVPADVEKIVIAVSIFEADQRGQTFGQVRNAFIRLVDTAKGSEEVKYDLTEDYSTETAVNFAELYRNNGEWKFKAIGQGYDTGMVGVANDFGVAI
jgi:tellurium resistance protein TerD